MRSLSSSLRTKKVIQIYLRQESECKRVFNEIVSQTKRVNSILTVGCENKAKEKMESTGKVQDYDLMFITDATGSMGRFLDDLKSALPQIFDLVQLTNMINRISVLAFRDYCDSNLIEWSGWSNALDTSKLMKFVQNLQASGGGDEPEAVKTGLWRASEKVEKPTICIMYVDAPPHHDFEDKNAGDNYDKEVKAFAKRKVNPQWLSVCRMVRDHKMFVYPVFPSFYDNVTYPFFASVAEITNGQCVQIGNSSVVRATIGILLNLAGIEFEYDKVCKNIAKEADIDYEMILADRSKYNELQKKNLYATGPINISAIEDIKIKSGNPIVSFQTSEEYKELVFKVFERLLLPERILAFTYNTLFGKLWREICKQRKDPRRDALVERLSQTVKEISESDRTVLQSFIEDTYDSSAEIDSIIQPYGLDGPFYVIEHDHDLPRKTLFEIGLSCAPSIVQSVLQLFTKLRITSQLPHADCNLTYLPVNLPSNLKFKLLPHLIRPGTMFSLRLGAIMASLAKLSGSILQDDATQFLNEIRGKWIDLELPECNSVDFARLMMRLKGDALTAEEAKHFRALILISSLKRCKGYQIDVETSYSSFKTKRPDYKDKCKTCGQHRSVTLLLDDTCALCIKGKSATCMEPKSEKDESWMCECRKCLVHYAVYDIDALKCRAKCHFCRLGQPVPSVTCQMCKNKFLYQRSGPLPNYVCAVCTENKDRVGEKHKVTFLNYVQKNGTQFIGFDVDVATFFADSYRLSKVPIEEKLKAMRNFDNISDEHLKNHTFAVGESFKDVWNVKGLQKQVHALLYKQKLQPCMICFEGFHSEKLMPICGLTKSGCKIEACRKCLNTWYNQLAPGRVCQPAQLVCCYCKRVPQIKIVRQYNRQLCTLINTMDVTAFDPSYIYAWCTKCFVIKQAMPRECGRDLPEIVDFKCADCLVTVDSTILKECPKCKVPTEKCGGCNHIACVNVLDDGTICDAHWCWVCGELSTDADIYTHLSQQHGGFFSPEDAEYFDEQMYVDE